MSQKYYTLEMNAFEPVVRVWDSKENCDKYRSNRSFDEVSVLEIPKRLVKKFAPDDQGCGQLRIVDKSKVCYNRGIRYLQMHDGYIGDIIQIYPEDSEFFKDY